MSCVNDVDFDQVDDIEINTPHKVSLIYFSLDSTNFLDENGNETFVISDVTEFPFFNSSMNEDYLIQVDFEFEAINLFDRDISINLRMLDESANATYQFTPLVVTAGNSSFSQVETLTGNDLAALVSSSFIEMNIVLDSGAGTLDPLSSFEFKSGLTLNYQYTVEDE